MASTLIVSPNLALDHIVVVDSGDLTGVLRAAGDELSAGGKGMNVARALACDSHTSRVFGFAGGYVGQLVEARAGAEGLRVTATEVDDETRIATVICNGERDMVVINGRGPYISHSHLALLEQALLDAVATQRPSVVICAGSVPPGCDASLYASLLSASQDVGAYTIIDMSGSLLRDLLLTRPDLIKVNLYEAREALGAEYSTREPQLCAQALHEASGADVILTLGQAGAVSSCARSVFHVNAPPVTVRNAVGAGDTLLAGIVAATAQGASLLEALPFGVASAAASAETLIPGSFDPKRRDQLLRSMQDPLTSTSNVR